MKRLAPMRVINCATFLGIFVASISACSSGDAASGKGSPSATESGYNAAEVLSAALQVGPKRDVRGVRLGMTPSQVRRTLRCGPSYPHRDFSYGMRDQPTTYDESLVVCDQSSEGQLNVIFSSAAAGERVVEASYRTAYPGQRYVEFVQAIQTQYGLGNPSYETEGFSRDPTYGWVLDGGQLTLEAHCQRVCDVTIKNDSVRREAVSRSSGLWLARQRAVRVPRL